MHLFKPLHHWHQTTGLGSQQSTPYLQSADFNKIFFHLFQLWNSLQLHSIPPQMSSGFLSSCFSLLPAVLYPVAWHQKLSERMVGLPWPLAPSPCRAGECSPSSSPNDVTYMRTSYLNHNLWTCSQMLRGVFMWLYKRRMLYKLGKVSRERPGEDEPRHRERRKRKNEFFWSSVCRNVSLRNRDLITTGFYLV